MEEKMLSVTQFESTMTMPLDSQLAILSTWSEAALVAEARSGSAPAVEQLVSRYETRLFRLAWNITSNHEDAEEVVQNAFFKAFQNLAAFRGDSSFYTWLVRIATNEALMKIRGHRFREVSVDAPKEAEDHIFFTELQDWAPTPEQRYSQQELSEILETTINKLESGYRIVFQLRDIEGLSTEETARTLDLSLPAVKSRLRRARFQLRNLLDPYFRVGRRALRSPRVNEMVE
jgi:RNA polymerase sigma-70 factor, ECF subfamily